MREFLEPYGPVWRVLNFLTDLLGLSLCFFLCCIPVVTIGAAVSALYDGAVRGMRYGTSGVYSRFFETFRREFKPATAQLALWGAAWLLLSFFANVMGNQGSIGVVYRMISFVPVVIFVWAELILSRFTYGFRDLTATAARIALGHLPWTLLLIALTVLICFAVVVYPVLIAIAPACMALGWSLPAETVFARYGGSLSEPECSERKL